MPHEEFVRQRGERYLEKQIQKKTELADKDVDFLRKKLLGMYANPLVNYLQVK